MPFLLDGIRLVSTYDIDDEEQPSLLWNFHLNLPGVMKNGPRKPGSTTAAVWHAADRIGVRYYLGWRLFRNLVRYGAVQPVMGEHGRALGYRKRPWHHRPAFESVPHWSKR